MPDVRCLECNKVIGETIAGGYLARRGGFRLEENGDLYQQCRHCGAEFRVGRTGRGEVMLIGETGSKIFE